MEVRKPIEIKPGQTRCPRCFGLDLVRSRRRGLLDNLMHRWGREPLHCRFCGRRFYSNAQGTAAAGANRNTG